MILIARKGLMTLDIINSFKHNFFRHVLFIFVSIKRKEFDENAKANVKFLRRIKQGIIVHEKMGFLSI